MTTEQRLAVLQRLKLQVNNAERWISRLDKDVLWDTPFPFDFVVGDFYIRDTKWPNRPMEEWVCPCGTTQPQHTDAVGACGCKVTTSTIQP